MIWENALLILVSRFAFKAKGEAGSRFRDSAVLPFAPSCRLLSVLLAKRTSFAAGGARAVASLDAAPYLLASMWLL